jgi:hypothetical protein
MNKQNFIALIIAILILALIIELVRRRKLSEKFSMLWIFAGFTLLFLSAIPGFLTLITKATGAITDTVILFGLGFIFMVLISLGFSMQLTSAFIMIKNLSQKIAVLEEALKKSRIAPTSKEFTNTIK